MSEPLRTVIVGLDHYHVTGWCETVAGFAGRLEVVGRYDSDPAREEATAPQFSDPHLAQQFPGWVLEVPFFSDLGQMIETCRPEVAIVTLPNVIAAEAITTLARAGVHMMVDKPGAATGAEAAAAFGAAREAGVRVAVALTRRYGRPWQEAARAVASGRLGRTYSAEAIFATSSVAVRDPANHIFKRSLMGGGILSWLGVHDIDLLQWLAGEPITEVQAMAGATNDAGVDVEDTISISFRFAGGALGTMHFAYALPRSGGEGYVALRGSQASLRLDAAGETVWIGPGTPADPLLEQRSQTTSVRLPGYGATGHQIIDDLLDAIVEQRDPLATGRHATAALHVIDAAYESARNGERVAVRGATV